MEKYGLKDDMQHPESFGILLENINEIHADDFMKLDENYAQTFIKYRDIIVLMLKFFTDMKQDGRKDHKYGYSKLRRLLVETEILPSRTL